ncbi:MAG: PD40 domain-containing protein, partial [Bacteroidetes bacterium]|nr:PD40 domain-containing protein [Bacteroidota bacterium]
MKPNSIINFIITFISVFFIISLLTSCHLPITKPKELVCPPPPPQNCRPQQWVGIPFDTISTIANSVGTYLKIEPVVLLNSPRDEWNVNFISSNIAAETYSDVSKIQSMQLVKFRAPEVASVQSSLSSEIIGSNGGFSVYKKNAVISALPKSNIPGDADLYSVDFSDKLLSEPTLIPAPISKHIDWDAQPALTPDGKVLFFASDRQGGIGGTDIWFSVNRGGDWSTPVNCGEQINSRCDDITPFVSFDGKYLLFASAGRESVGGYDIFISEILPAFRDFIRSDETIPPSNLPLFTSAKNYGAPLNTTRDELFPSSPAGIDTLLYYSSNQLPPENVSPSQSGGFDLYVLHKLSYSKELKRLAKEDNPIEEPSINVEIHGKVTNATTKEPIVNADITAKELSNQHIIDQTKSDTEGNYSLTVPTMKEIEISAQNEDLFYDSHKFRLSSKDTAVELNQNFSLPDKLFLRINFPSDVFDNPYQNVLDSNGNETTQTFLESLDLLAQNLTKFKDKIKKLLLIGHTDDVASDAYNMALGKRRVEFVVTELTKRGVPKSMFEARS